MERRSGITLLLYTSCGNLIWGVENEQRVGGGSCPSQTKHLIYLLFGCGDDRVRFRRTLDASNPSSRAAGLG